MNLDKKSIIGIVAAVFVIALVIFFGVSKKQSSVPGTDPADPPVGDNSQAQAPPNTREAPPKNVVVPGVGSVGVPENVATPEIVAPGSPQNSSSYRSFDIKAENGKFAPDTIIVREGDTTNIFVTAVDKDYDFTQPDYGFKVNIKRGKTEKIQFGATASGKFLFYCNACGGPAAGPKGYIIVASKN